MKRAYRWWKDWIHHWHSEIVVLVELVRHPNVPKLTKAIVIVLLSYIFSPIDLIPDFIPFFGHWDDFLMIPLTFWLINKTTPVELVTEIREKVANDPDIAIFSGKGPKIAAVTVVVLWLAITVWVIEILGFGSNFAF